MIELGQRERHFLSGLGVQVLVVAFLVFAYTQAARQVRSQREMVLKLNEQLAQAKAQVAKESAKSNVQVLQLQITQLQGQLLSPEKLEDMKSTLTLLAQRQFGFLGVEGVEVKEGPAEKTIQVPVASGPAFTVELRGLTLTGIATTRQASGFLAAIQGSFVGLLCPLGEMELKRGMEKEEPLPVRVRFKWLVAVSPDRGTGSPPVEMPAVEKSALSWGPREEPFLSPFQFLRGAYTPPLEAERRFRLTGILWEEGAPSCVVNGQILRVGERLSGYEVSLITPNAVLLSSPTDELFLSLP